MKSGRSALLGAMLFFACLFGTTPARAQFWQCAPYARMVSGIDLHGNAGTWWGKAAGRYDRGEAPAVGTCWWNKPIRAIHRACSEAAPAAMIFLILLESPGDSLAAHFYSPRTDFSRGRPASWPRRRFSSRCM